MYRVMLELYGANTSIKLHHREAMDHLKAWKGSAQAFNAILNQDFQVFLTGWKAPC